MNSWVTIGSAKLKLKGERNRIYVNSYSEEQGFVEVRFDCKEELAFWVSLRYQIGNETKALLKGRGVPHDAKLESFSVLTNGSHLFSFLSKTNVNFNCEVEVSLC